MYRYAIINTETGIVEGISDLTGEVNKPDMILIGDDFDVTNKKYVNGKWVGYTPEPLPEPEPTQLDRIEQAVKMSQQEIIDNYTLTLIEGGVI